MIRLGEVCSARLVQTKGWGARLETSKNLGERGMICNLLRRGSWGGDRMGRPAGFFDIEERLAGLWKKKGDDLERLATVDVISSCSAPELERAVPRADRSKGGRPPFDHVLMFKVLVLQTQNNLSDGAPSSTCATG